MASSASRVADAVPGARPGERIELVVGAEETSTRPSTGAGSAATCAVAPARVLPDPGERSLELAQVLGAPPEPEVHRRPLSVYEQAL